MEIELAEDQAYEERIEQIKAMAFKNKLSVCLKANALSLDNKDFVQALLSDIKYAWKDEHILIRELVSMGSGTATEKYLNDIIYTENL